MPRPNMERVPAAPFVAWLDREYERIRGDETFHEPGMAVPASRILGDRLGVSSRVVRRYHSSTTEERVDGRRVTVHTDWFERGAVEDMLDRAGVPFWKVYPEIAAAEDVPLEPDAACFRCRMVVTPIRGECPWCDTPIGVATAPRVWTCTRCEQEQRVERFRKWREKNKNLARYCDRCMTARKEAA